MDMKDGMVKLIQKLNEVRESMLGSDVIELTSKLDDANEYISKIAKLSNPWADQQTVLPLTSGTPAWLTV